MDFSMGFSLFEEAFSREQSVLQLPPKMDDIIAGIADASESENESDEDNAGEEDTDHDTLSTPTIDRDLSVDDTQQIQSSVTSNADQEDEAISTDEMGPDQVDDEEFKKMLPMTSFLARSGETIQVNDIVAMDNEVEESEWFARVVEVRSSPAPKTRGASQTNSARIWVKCHWFYTITHLKALIKDRPPVKNRLLFNMDVCGSNFELIETPDHVQIFVSTICKAKSNIEIIREDDERSITQRPLADGLRFSRIVFYINQYKGSKLNYVPYSFRSCACEHPPLNKRPKHFKANSIVNFCPNVTCKRWLHRDCLESYVIRRAPHVSLESRLIENQDGWDSTELEELQGRVNSPERCAAELMVVLRRVAARQITRRMEEPLANVHDICFARALLNMIWGLPNEADANWGAIEALPFVKAELEDPHIDPLLETCFWCPFCRSAV